MDKDKQLIKENDDIQNNNYTNIKINEMMKNNAADKRISKNMFSNINRPLINNNNSENYELNFSINNMKKKTEQNKKMVKTEKHAIIKSLPNELTYKSLANKRNIQNFEIDISSKKIYPQLNKNNKNLTHSSNIKNIAYVKNNNSEIINLNNLDIHQDNKKGLLKNSIHVCRNNSPSTHTYQTNISNGLSNLDKFQRYRYDNSNLINNSSNVIHHNNDNILYHNALSSSLNNSCDANTSPYYTLSDYNNDSKIDHTTTKDDLIMDKYYLINSKNCHDNRRYNESINMQKIPIVTADNRMDNIRNSNIKKSMVIHGRTRNKENNERFYEKIINKNNNINCNKNYNIYNNVYNRNNIKDIMSYVANYNTKDIHCGINKNHNVDNINYSNDNNIYIKKNIDTIHKNKIIHDSIYMNYAVNSLNNRNDNAIVIDNKTGRIKSPLNNDYKIGNKKINENKLCYKIQENDNENNFNTLMKSELFKTARCDEFDKINIIKIVPNNSNNCDDIEKKQKNEEENKNPNDSKSIDDLHSFLNAVNEYQSANKRKVKTVCMQDNISSYKKNKANIYQKRGSLNYSGILTSMVSSIITQQNEIKIEENNLDSSWKTNQYEYTLLHQLVDNEQKEKISSNKIEDFQKINSSDKVLILTLTLMICISVLCNYDHGAIPVTLEEIQKDFPLSYIEQSLLGSLVYFGLIIGTIIASVLFELLSAKLLVTISIVLLSISLYIFSHANCITFMYISRFVNGLCQAIPVVYLPVWVDEFSPDEKATQWMSYIQLASIGGTVFGYFLGGILSNSNHSHHKNGYFFNSLSFFTTWRSPFLIQALLLLPIFLILIFIPSDKINITSNCSDSGKSNETEKENNEKVYPLTSNSKHMNEQQKYKRNKSYESKNSTVRMNFNRSATYIMEKKTNILKKTFKEVKKLLKNRLYIIITLGMSNLYFVVTGIQFWITEYMSVVLLTEKIKIVTVSTLCFLTSPTSGVWFGGYICDLFGGYKNTNYSKTIKVATSFAISACIFGILSAHLNNFIFFSISLWLCLFSGSALVPVAVGMLLSCVDNHQKSLSSAVSQVIYNVFGWFSAPLLSGIIMDIMHKYTNDNRLALKAGFTMILYSSSIGFFLLLYANFLDFSDKKENDELLELEEPLT